MALVIKVGYFCTGGYTETGSIQGFLERINPNVRFVRCFPMVNKPCLKIGRMSSTPIRSQNGVSGDELINEMKSKLRHPGMGEFDVILLIDDLDCRFKRAGAPNYQEWRNSVNKELCQLLCREVSFEVMFASPEIEAWFVADWNNTFAKEAQYRAIKDQLRYSICSSDINEFINNIEEYGGYYHNGSCYNKLSTRIQQIFNGINSQPNYIEYSKRIHGVGMLARLDPSIVAEKCRLYFAPVYRRLVELH